MADPLPFTINPSAEAVSAWKDVSAYFRPLSQLQEIGIERTASGSFSVGAIQCLSLGKAIAAARMAQSRQEEQASQDQARPFGPAASRPRLWQVLRPQRPPPASEGT